jgi:methyltransferase family protein
VPDLRSIFMKLENRSIKWDTYFPAYESLFGSFVGRKATLVEIGVLNGGSLSMWREYLGPQARIIGIDNNPVAKRLVEQGFEIFIGDQASPEFWKSFFAQVGPIDVLIDDGGHTNRQQIVTVDAVVENVNDGGRVIVEDTHASYLQGFGNPSRYSFVNFAKGLVDRINARSPRVCAQAPRSWTRMVHSIEFFESIVCLKVDRTLCKQAMLLSAGSKSIEAEDHREADKSFRFLKALPFKGLLASACQRILYWNENRRLGGYFEKW